MVFSHTWSSTEAVRETVVGLLTDNRNGKGGCPQPLA